MSGPPHWLAYAWAASLWVAVGCVGMAGVAAVVDWVTAACGSRTDATGVRSAELPAEAVREGQAAPEPSQARTADPAHPSKRSTPA